MFAICSYGPLQQCSDCPTTPPKRVPYQATHDAAPGTGRCNGVQRRQDHGDWISKLYHRHWFRAGPSQGASSKLCGGKYLRWAVLKGIGNSHKVEDCEVALASLDFPHMRPVYACCISKGFLG